MLIFPANLSSQPQTFADHANPQVKYALPTGMTIATTSAGVPDFFLLRYAGDFSTARGGLLRFQLAFEDLSRESLSTAEQSIRAIAFSRGYFRVRVRSHLGENSNMANPNQVGSWYPLILTGSTVSTNPVGLSTHEAEILKQLLEEGRNSVEVELDLRYQGLVTVGPWLVTANLPDLKYHLLAKLGADAVSADQVVAAFLSLPEETSPVSWRSLQPDGPDSLKEPSREIILTETAWRSLETLFKAESVTDPSASTLYQLIPIQEDDVSTFSWNLLTPRLAERPHFLSWQSSELKPYLIDPKQRQALFPTVDQLTLFGTTEIHVINHLPFDAHHLKEIRVSLRFSGATGVPEYHNVVFDADSSTLEPLRVVYPAFSPFQLDYQVTAVLAPSRGGGWPILLKKDFVAADSTVVEIDRHVLDIEMVQVLAEPSVFNQCSAIAVELWPESAPIDKPDDENKPLASTQLTLTADRHAAWVTLPDIQPDTPLQMRCVAVPPEGTDRPSHTLTAGSVVNRSIHIASHLLEVLSPDYISITSDVPASEFAYIAVSVASISAADNDAGQLYSLVSGKTHRWPLFRSSIFEAPQFRYQIHYVAYDDAGRSLPISTTNWLTATGTSLLIDSATIRIASGTQS
ncbi:MAG: hypothetical protein AAFQ40_00110 [Cyanobacteria bacterium J06623_5]